jgi:hypothetical protein
LLVERLLVERLRVQKVGADALRFRRWFVEEQELNECPALLELECSHAKKMESCECVCLLFSCCQLSAGLER